MIVNVSARELGKVQKYKHQPLDKCYASEPLMSCLFPPYINNTLNSFKHLPLFSVDQNQYNKICMLVCSLSKLKMFVNFVQYCIRLQCKHALAYNSLKCFKNEQIKVK